MGTCFYFIANNNKELRFNTKKSDITALSSKFPSYWQEYSKGNWQDNNHNKKCEQMKDEKDETESDKKKYIFIKFLN